MKLNIPAIIFAGNTSVLVLYSVTESLYACLEKATRVGERLHREDVKVRRCDDTAFALDGSDGLLAGPLDLDVDLGIKDVTALERKKKKMRMNHQRFDEMVLSAVESLASNTWLRINY